ncbi:uncharacterized protein [Drosophila virilis]|uniref:uncharacterized protein isoform X2 n=1 Tax=Drosophila virilis TaxID=7244 RepID=UPI00139640C3|nr:uncharacterized protein LOC6630445 isoform X2 [Drosophila virilis]
MMFCKLRRLELLRSGQLSDCELHVWYTDKFKKSCCRQFQCHKVMLASASEEFERMFEETETRTRNMLVMNVNDASPDAYETLLLYIYTYEIYNDITIEMCPDLIYLATKYKMPDFVDGYIGKLANQNWPMGTVLKIFQLANEHNRPAMMKLVGKKFVEVTHLFGEPLFEADGTLAISDNDENEPEATESPKEPEPVAEEPELPQSPTPKEVAAAAQIQPASGEDKPEDEQLPTSSEDEARSVRNKLRKSADSSASEKRTLQRSPQRASPRNPKRISNK